MVLLYLPLSIFSTFSPSPPDLQNQPLFFISLKTSRLWWSIIGEPILPIHYPTVCLQNRREGMTKVDCGTVHRGRRWGFGSASPHPRSDFSHIIWYILRFLVTDRLIHMLLILVISCAFFFYLFIRILFFVFNILLFNVTMQFVCVNFPLPELYAMIHTPSQMAYKTN